MKVTELNREELKISKEVLKMNKIYLKDLSIEDLKELCKNNDSFMEQFYQDLYDRNMDLQCEEGILMFGKDWHTYINMIDNYNSFYLRLKDWRMFIENLDGDYLCQQGIDLYNNIINDKTTLDKMDEDNELYDNLEEHLENMCKLLLEICEKQLHEYEDYPMFDDVFDYMYDNELYLEYYTDENKQKIYVDVSYTKEF